MKDKNERESKKWFTAGIEPWEEMTFECKGCRRSHVGHDLELGVMYEAYAAMVCPDCGEIVVFINFPLSSEAAANLDKIPPENRRRADEFLAALAEWDLKKLRSPDQLPEIGQDAIALIWDEEDPPGKGDVVIRFGDREIYRGPPAWDKFGYFNEAFEVLRKKYGERLYGLIPTERANRALWGDSASTPKKTGGTPKDIREATRFKKFKVDMPRAWKN